MKGNKMKNLKSLTVLMFLFLLTVQLVAGPKKTVSENVEENLLIGLQSDNLGLKTSSAYMLGEYGTSKSVISLMKVLKNGDTEEERISAALALIKINTDKARFAVKQRAKFDESERVRRYCAMFYQQSLAEI
jgi:HEAT repeat protein